MIWILLVVYQIKHFIADYPLQGRYMLGKFKPYPDFILPLLSHGAVHGVMTFTIAAFLKPLHVALVLGLVDMTIHSVVDWIKANPSIGGRFTALSKKEMVGEVLPLLKELERPGGVRVGTPLHNEIDEAMVRVKSNTYFWWALGADQFAHHLTHYLLIWAMLP